MLLTFLEVSLFIRPLNTSDSNFDFCSLLCFVVMYLLVVLFTNMGWYC